MTCMALEEGRLFLAPTAEVPVTNLERDRIVAPDEFPIKYARLQHHASGVRQEHPAKRTAA